MYWLYSLRGSYWSFITCTHSVTSSRYKYVYAFMYLAFLYKHPTECGPERDCSIMLLYGYPICLKNVKIDFPNTHIAFVHS